MDRMKTKKIKSILAWTAALILLAFGALFVAFLISEQAEKARTIIINETTVNETTVENQKDLNLSCDFKLELVEVNESFEWHDFNWKKEKELHRVELNIIERHGLAAITTTVSFRHNPFTLEKIASNVSSMPASRAYVAYDKSVLSCNDTILGGVELGYFLGLLGVKAEAAFTEKTPETGNFPIKSCKDATENITVLVLKATKCEPYVIQQDNCIILEAGNCYPVEAVERLILDFIKIGSAKDIIKPGK